LALATCHCESGSARSPAPVAPRVPSENRDVRTHMAAHLSAAAELQAAIAQGRLADAREQAAWFASHEMEAPPAWSAHIVEMRYAASRIRGASDVATAGSQIGRLGRACSSCHEAQHAKPAFAYEPVPADDGTLEAQMQRHQWAAARLWEGLVGPDDQRWDDGARVLATTQFAVAQSAHKKPNAEAIELGERMREQASEAIEVRDHDARASYFGTMMETCASCHTLVRPAPVVSTGQGE